MQPLFLPVAPATRPASLETLYLPQGLSEIEATTLNQSLKAEGSMPLFCADSRCARLKPEHQPVASSRRYDPWTFCHAPDPGRV